LLGIACLGETARTSIFSHQFPGFGERGYDDNAVDSLKEDSAAAAAAAGDKKASSSSSSANDTPLWIVPSLSPKKNDDNWIPMGDFGSLWWSNALLDLEWLLW
jgi:hypothetical protein